MSASLFVLAVAASQLLSGVSADLIRKSEVSQVVLAEGTKADRMASRAALNKKHFLKHSAKRVESADASAVLPVTEKSKKVKVQDEYNSWVYFWYYSSDSCAGDVIQQDSYYDGACFYGSIYTCDTRKFHSFFSSCR